ncbi:hypothetical protein FRC09_009021 [Ceratobasidium sp. 395]|nr:hypothetical protein FRC09_009021 [Ceratobasidium sp. 395]
MREDLRRTSIQPSQVKAAFWPRDTLLPVSENVEYFAPYPQHRIPELLQQLDKSSFLHSQAGSDAKYPYVIHIDRIRPESHCHSRSRGSAGVSRIAQNVYHVSDTYVQPSDREERNRSQYERPQWHSKANYADDYCTSDEPDWWTEYEYPSDSEDVQSMNEDDSRSERSSTSSSKDSFDSAESPGIASPISQSHLPPSAIGVCTSRSPPPLTPNLFVDNAPPQGSVASHASLHEPTQDGICTINSENQANVSSSQIPSLSTTNGQPTNDSLESLSGSSSNDSLVDVLEYESGNAKRAITGFFNPRVQAGLAPPKRKRGHRYSSESSKSNDSEGNLEGDHKKQRTILSSLGNVELLLLRRPPSWSTAQKLVAARQKIKASAGFQSRDQSGTNKSVLGSAQLAKKKESILDGGRAAWNRIKESSSKKSLSPSSIANLKAITSPSAISQSQASPSVTLSQPLSAQDKSTRRTTIGRPPKAPGTVVWKLN